MSKEKVRIVITTPDGNTSVSEEAPVTKVKAKSLGLSPSVVEEAIRSKHAKP